MIVHPIKGCTIVIWLYIITKTQSYETLRSYLSSIINVFLFSSTSTGAQDF